MMNFGKVKRKQRTPLGVLGILFAFLLVNTAVYGQTPAPTQTPPPVNEDFDDKEFDLFLNANQKINGIQMEAQGQMMQIIEKEGLSVEKFNTMAQGQQAPDSTATKQDPKDVESFQKAAEKIEGMQQGLEEKMVKAVEDEGLEVETYMQIAQAYQQSPKVKGILDQKMKEKQQADVNAVEQK